MALWSPNPFRGIGLLFIPLLPLILAWYAVIWGAIVAGIALAVLCLGARWSLPIGAVLIGLSATNIVSIIRAYSAHQADSERSAEQVREYEREIARCNDANLARFKMLSAYFETPRTVVGLSEPGQIAFENGVKVNIARDPSPAASESFARFYHERLENSKVRVVLTEPSSFGGCPSAQDRFGYAGAVYLDEKPVTSSAVPTRAFPICVRTRMQGGRQLPCRAGTTPGAAPACTPRTRAPQCPATG